MTPAEAMELVRIMMDQMGDKLVAFLMLIAAAWVMFGKAVNSKVIMIPSYVYFAVCAVITLLGANVPI